MLTFKSGFGINFRGDGPLSRNGKQGKKLAGAGVVE